MADLSGKSFNERFFYYARQTANENGYNNLGDMAANSMRHNMTASAGAGPALVALIKTLISYFD